MAEAADAALGLAGQDRTDLDALDTGLLDAGGELETALKEFGQQFGMLRASAGAAA